MLLGDVVELVEGRPREAMDVAEPVLRALGARLGSAAEVIVVPGNHDAAFVRPWVRARDGSLGVETPIPLDATPALARLTSWLAPARVRVSYPGVWLADRVWATHGHYLDRHLLPEAAYGVARGLLGRLPRDGATPADYEGGPSATRVEALLTRWLPRPLAELLDDLAELLRAATMPGSPRRALGRRLAPFAQRALGSADAPREHPRAGAGRPPARGGRRLGGLRARPSLRAAGRRRPAPVERAGGRAADRATPARGSTSRCCCIA